MNERRDEVQVLDVRQPEEWAAGRIEGATLIPMSDVADRLEQIARDRTVVVVCRSGRRSGKVAKYLARSGFSADNLDGGLDRWDAEGLPLTSGADAGHGA